MHTRRMARTHAVEGVFHYDALGRIDAQSRGRQQEDVWLRLATVKLIAAGKHIKLGSQAKTVELLVRLNGAR